ncbi:MAG: hypothetical protein GWP19_10835 [Planctomycetia bacterium]|nr:hypothetical protein [Planctomycetia bacterium]
MNSRSKLTALVVIALFCISSFSFSQITKNDIILGKRISIESKVLNEIRNLYIYLPEGYGESNENYPVMYVLDGETNFTISAAIVNFFAGNQQIPQMIVVGIPNVARNRDFTPTVSKQLQNSGGADNFIDFLSDELITYIDYTYRTQNYKILFGHSLCGMFSVYTLFTNPDLFDAYIAVSPYLMYEDEYVIHTVENILNNQTNFTNQLYMSIGDEPVYFNSLDKLTSLFTTSKSGVHWTLEKYLDEDHGSIPFRTIADGLGFIFSDWQLTNDIAMKGVNAIKKHFLNRSNKYGFTTQITELTLNAIGYQLLQAGKTKKAIDVFKYNVELYPNSANVYDSLGDGFDKIGKKKKALDNYKKAVSIGEKINDPNLAAFRNNLERLKNQ